MLSPPPPPSPAGFQTISIHSHEVALAKLGATFSAEDLITAIREVGEAKRAERRAVMCEHKWPAAAACPLSLYLFNMLVALQCPEQSSRSQIITRFYFVQDPPRPEEVDQRANERLRPKYLRMAGFQTHSHCRGSADIWILISIGFRPLRQRASSLATPKTGRPIRLNRSSKMSGVFGTPALKSHSLPSILSYHP